MQRLLAGTCQPFQTICNEIYSSRSLQHCAIQWLRKRQLYQYFHALSARLQIAYRGKGQHEKRCTGND